jgi:hypothetical protein
MKNARERIFCWLTTSAPGATASKFHRALGADLFEICQQNPIRKITSKPSNRRGSSVAAATSPLATRGMVIAEVWRRVPRFSDLGNGTSRAG